MSADGIKGGGADGCAAATLPVLTCCLSSLHFRREQWEEHSRLGFSACFIQPIDPEYLAKANVKLPAGLHPDEWDPFHSMIIADELMRCGFLGVVWSLGGGNSIGGPPIIRFGSKQLKDEILPDLLAGRKRVCLVSAATALDMACTRFFRRMTKRTDTSHSIYIGRHRTSSWIRCCSTQNNGGPLL